MVDSFIPVYIYLVDLPTKLSERQYVEELEEEDFVMCTFFSLSPRL